MHSRFNVFLPFLIEAKFFSDVETFDGMVRRALSITGSVIVSCSGSQR